jgi:integrase/recombinase XerD
MTTENCYENFRTVLTLNLSSVIQDPETLNSVLSMVDLSMSDFEISKKPMEIIPVDGFPEVAKYFLASKGVANLSKSTLKQYRYKLIHFFDTVRKSYLDITANDIRIYLFNFKQERNASDCYVDNVRITLNSFFQWLVDNEYLQRNPCAKIDKIKYQQKRREPLSTLSLENLRVHCKNEREKALIDFLFSTGCRISECAGVLISDIDWERNSVHLRYCKGNKERMVYFNDEAKVSLRAYIEKRGHISPALWTSMKEPHQQLQAHALENIVKKIGERTGVHTYPHKLRHTFATVGLRNGMPLEKLQALLGHTNPQTTLIYAKLNDDIMQLEHQKAFC